MKTESYALKDLETLNLECSYAIKLGTSGNVKIRAAARAYASDILFRFYKLARQLHFHTWLKSLAWRDFRINNRCLQWLFSEETLWSPLGADAPKGVNAVLSATNPGSLGTRACLTRT